MDPIGPMYGHTCNAQSILLGGVGWKYVDVTCLVCPSKAKISAGFGMATDLTGGGARKKRKVLQGETLNSIDQSEASSESENSTSRR